MFKQPNNHVTIINKGIATLIRYNEVAIDPTGFFCRITMNCPAVGSSVKELSDLATSGEAFTVYASDDGCFSDCTVQYFHLKVGKHYSDSCLEIAISGSYRATDKLTEADCCIDSTLCLDNVVFGSDLLRKDPRHYSIEALDLTINCLHKTDFLYECFLKIDNLGSVSWQLKDELKCQTSTELVSEDWLGPPKEPSVVIRDVLAVGPSTFQQFMGSHNGVAKIGFKVPR